MRPMPLFALAATLLLGAPAAFVVAETNPDNEKKGEDEYSNLVREAARVLERLPEAQREEVKKRLTELENVRERMAYLRDFLQKNADLADPRKTPRTPEEWQQELVRRGLEWFQNLPEDQRKDMMEDFQKGVQNLLQSLPEEERREIMKNALRELQRLRLPAARNDDDDKKDEEKPRDEGPSWLEEIRRYSEEAQRLYQAYQSMPEEQRRQMIEDVLEGARIYFDDNIRPELERELARLQVQAQAALEEMAKIQELPPAERRKAVRERVRKLARDLYDEYFAEKKDGEGNDY